MNDDINEILNFRATILRNIDGLHSYGVKSGKDKNQLSLFGDSVESKLSLEKPDNVNYRELIEQEKDLLGVYLTYNPFDEHILISKKFCNNNVESLLALNKDYKSGVVLLARIKEIKYKVSAAGNGYAKLIIEDPSATSMIYLWGKKYTELLPMLFSNQIYLIELGYKKDGDTLFVVNMRKAVDVPIERIVKKITLFISDVEYIPKVREFIFNKMIGDKFELTFAFGGELYNAPYKINFTSDDYHYLKEFITEIKI